MSLLNQCQRLQYLLFLCKPNKSNTHNTKQNAKDIGLDTVGLNGTEY